MQKFCYKIYFLTLAIDITRESRNTGCPKKTTQSEKRPYLSKKFVSRLENTIFKAQLGEKYNNLLNQKMNKKNELTFYQKNKTCRCVSSRRLKNQNEEKFVTHNNVMTRIYDALKLKKFAGLFQEN